MAKILLCYPPGEQYQRGEDRCQSNIKASTATTMRACNDLGYCAAILKQSDQKHEIMLKDYASENISLDIFYENIKNYQPDFIIMSNTNATIFDDIAIITKAKKYYAPDTKIILKGAIFFKAEQNLIEQLNLEYIDVLVGSEIEFIIRDLIESGDYSKIPGIFYKNNSNQITETEFKCWNKNLDSLPFPDRSLMKNELYTRPDTGEPMATIQVARGCPSQCIYCLTPIISGKTVRMRSPENVLEELRECYNKYHIKNFFFKADTFTINREWVLKLCDLIKQSELNNKIAYTANSRVKPLSQDILNAMAETGCFTIAFGFESGNEQTLKQIKKGSDIQDAINAVKMAKKAKIPIYGFFMIGFPWESLSDIKQTIKFMRKLNCDFVEVHIALPYYGTELYQICDENNLLDKSTIGVDYFHSNTKGTCFVNSKQLQKIRHSALLKYHLRPSYIFKKLITCKDFKTFKNYVKFGLKLLRKRS